MEKKILWIDVSKDNLVIFNRLTWEISTIANETKAILNFTDEFHKTFSNIKDWKVWIESTWDYSLLPIREFWKVWYQIIFLNPIVTRKYIKWTIRGKKTDESDSELISIAVANWEWESINYETITPDYKKVSIRTEHKIKQISSDLKRYKKSLEKKKDSWVDNIENIISKVENLIDNCTKTCKELEELVLEWWQTKQEELIDSIPWFAQKLSCIVSTELWDIRRFPTSKQLRAFIWLDPRVSQSWNMSYIWRMTKHWNPHLRSAMYLAAKVAAIHDSHMKKIYEEKRAEWKAYRHVINIIASKLCNRLHAVVTKWVPYRKE